MILFDQDFEEQGAVVHYETKNKSFIKMSVLLKRMGVENNRFFLALTQRDLAHVDPHDPNISADLKHRIAYECKINPWYYIREVVRVPAGGSDGIRYELNRANLALTWSFFNSMDLFLTMPRQIGKTIGVQTIVSWIYCIAGVNVMVGLFARNGKLVLENVDRLKLIRDNLPKYLYKPGSGDTNNKEGLEYKALGNKYRTYIAPTERRKANDFARGESIPIQHWDEMSYFNNNDLAYPAATSTSDKVAPQVRATGLPACNMITTTAGRLDDPRGQYAYGIMSSCMRFDESLYDCKDRAALETIVSTQSNNQMVYIEYSYKQLGMDEAWLARVTRNKTAEQIATDYLNKWLHGSGTGLIPVAILNKIDASLMEPVAHTFVETLMLRWYVDPDRLKEEYGDVPFIIGSDNSDNIGRDFTTIVMSDPADMSVVCTCRCNLSNLVHVATCMVELLEMFPRSILIPERNKNGAVLIDMILVAMRGKHFDPFQRIYNTYVQDYNSETPSFHTLDIEDGNVRKAFGFTTTRSETSRERLYKSVLMTALELNHSRIFDSDLAAEIKGLTIRNGRIDHTESGHDDLVVAYLLACYFVLYGKNLHMYGIDEDEYLSEIDETGDTIAADTKARYNQAIERIRYLENQVELTQSDVMRNAYIRELKHLKATLPEHRPATQMVSAEQMKKESDDAAMSVSRTILDPARLQLFF